MGTVDLMASLVDPKLAHLAQCVYFVECMAWKSLPAGVPELRRRQEDSEVDES